MKKLEERLAKVPLPPLSPGQTKRFTDAVFPQEGGSDSGNKIVSHRTWLARAAIWTVLVSLTSALAWYANRDIWQSAREGDIDAVNQRLASGTDINARGEDQDLINRIIANSSEAEELKDISTETTPLYQAAFNGHNELVELLLEKGADPNIKTKAGTTALMGAAYGGHKRIAELLIAHGADVNVKGEDKGFLEYVIKHGATGENLREFTNLETFPLLQAAYKGHKEIVQLLIKNGADVNTTIPVGHTALMAATAGGHTETVRVLIENGANVNALREGWAVPMLNSALTSMIHHAPPERANYYEIAKLLITSGADIHATDPRGRTPLHLKLNNLELVKLLVAKGADVNAKDKSDNTPLDSYAGDPDSKEVYKFLRQQGAKFSTIIFATHARDIDEVKAFLAKGADVNMKNDGLATALCAAVFGRGGETIAELLISKGAKVNVEVDQGYTPLHFASYDGNKKCVELLLANGASVNSQIKEGKDKGQTPLDSTKTKNSRLTPEQNAARKEIADLLRKHGAKTGESISSNRTRPVIYYGLKIVSSNSSSRVNKETIENRSMAANHHIKYVTTLRKLK